MIRRSPLPDDDRDDHELPKSAPAQRADALPTGVSRKPRGRGSRMRTAGDAVTIKHGHEIVIPPPTKLPEALDTRLIVGEDAGETTSRPMKAGHQRICLSCRPDRVGWDKPAARRTQADWSSATAEGAIGDRQYFLSAVDALRINLPPKHPVVVRTGRQFISKDGDCCLVDGTFRIRISRELSLPQAIDVLIHEWAHALLWHTCVGGLARSRRISAREFDRLAHGPKWGLAYSKVYQCFTYDIEPRLHTDVFNATRLEGRRSRRKGGTK